MTQYAYEDTPIERRQTPDEIATFERNITTTTISYRDNANHADAMERAESVVSRGNIQSVATIRVRTVTVKQTQRSL